VEYLCLALLPEPGSCLSLSMVMSELPKWAEALGPPRVILSARKGLLVASLSPAILTLGKVQSGVFTGIVQNLWISLKRTYMFIILSFPIHEH